MTSSDRTRSSHFGTVQQLPSGQWRARYPAPNGKRPSQTFPTKTDAWVWLAGKQTDLVRKKQGIPPAASKATVGSLALAYLERGGIRESTRALNRNTWHQHLEPTWADMLAVEVRPEAVRKWHTAAQRSTGATALAQAYRLLRAIFNVAVHDEVVEANPCRLKAASSAKRQTPVRVLSPGEVMRVANETPENRRALVLVLGFGGLRFGEAAALRRRDVAPDGSWVHVTRAVYGQEVGPPKTDAGERVVNLPETVAKVVAAHLANIADSPDALLFGTKGGRYLARQNWNTTLNRAVKKAGLPRIKPHWLRHTGATLAAQSGATTKELMSRIGHSSPNAAIIYQHAVEDRDRAIADALNKAIADS